MNNQGPNPIARTLDANEMTHLPTTESEGARDALKGQTNQGLINRYLLLAERAALRELVCRYIREETVEEIQALIPSIVYFNHRRPGTNLGVLQNSESYVADVANPGNVPVLYGIPTSQPAYLQALIDEVVAYLEAYEAADRLASRKRKVDEFMDSLMEDDTITDRTRNTVAGALGRTLGLDEPIVYPQLNLNNVQVNGGAGDDSDDGELV
jgi:hypothetical protein